MIKFYIKGQEEPLYREDGNWNWICDNYYEQLHREDGPAVVFCNLDYATDYYSTWYFLNGFVAGKGFVGGSDPVQYLEELNPSIENLIVMSLDNNDYLREAAMNRLDKLVGKKS